jgi:hypothetical protein
VFRAVNMAQLVEHYFGPFPFGSPATGARLFVGDFRHGGHDQAMVLTPYENCGTADAYESGVWRIYDVSAAPGSWLLRGSVTNMDPAGEHWWQGDFSGSGSQQVLLYYADRHADWYLYRFPPMVPPWDAQSFFRAAGTTYNFPDVGEGKLSWTGDFTAVGRRQLLFYNPADMKWSLGTLTSGNLGWQPLGNTIGFGEISRDPFWTGDFTTPGRTQIMFYSPGDFHWFAGTVAGDRIGWKLVHNSQGFGQVADGRPFWTGDFDGIGHAEIMFHYPSDGNWFVGSIRSDGMLQWRLAGNTKALGQVTGGQSWVGGFTGAGRSQVLSCVGTHWWLSTVQANGLDCQPVSALEIQSANVSTPITVPSQTVTGRFLAGPKIQLIYYQLSSAGISWTLLTVE